MIKHNDLTDINYWNNIWKVHYLQEISENHWKYGRNGEFLKVISKNVGNYENASVIELGGACSYFGVALAKWLKAKVTLIDYSPLGIEKTKEIFIKNSCMAEYILDDMFTHDYKGREFDLVIHFGLLEHFSQPQPVLELCSKLVSNKGRIFFSVPNLSAYGARFWKMYSPNNWKSHIYHSYDLLNDACEKSGLQIEKVFYSGAPLLKPSEWEINCIETRMISYFQIMLNYLYMLVPITSTRTGRIVKIRNFVIKKASSSSGL